MADDDDDPTGKKDGMGRAERHADEHWWNCMLESAKAVAERKQWFQSKHVKAWCHKYHPNATTHEYKAMGPLMNKAASFGYCVPSLDYRASGQRNDHSRPQLVWISLIYKGPKRHHAPRRRPLDSRQGSFDLDDLDG